MAGGGTGGGSGAREGGLDEKQLPQYEGVWMEVWGGGSSHFAILLRSRPGLCWRPGGAGGSESAVTRPLFYSAHQSKNRQRLPGQTGSDPRNLCLLTNDDR